MFRKKKSGKLKWIILAVILLALIGGRSSGKKNSGTDTKPSDTERTVSREVLGILFKVPEDWKTGEKDGIGYIVADADQGTAIKISLYSNDAKESTSDICTELKKNILEIDSNLKNEDFKNGCVFRYVVTSDNKKSEKRIYFFTENDESIAVMAESYSMDADRYLKTADYTNAAVPSATPEPTPTPTPEPEVNQNEIRPEFKEMMDSYEAFIDEYVELTKQVNGGNTSTQLLLKYAECMNKLLEMQEKFEAAGQEDLTEAEALYYTEVSLRISKKLLEIQ